MILDSLSAKTPSLAARLVRAATSSLLVVWLDELLNALVINSENFTNGYKEYIINFSTPPIKGAICFQYRAPIDFGMISENIRIAMVKTAEIHPKYSSPKTKTACAPTPAAPTVWAIVLKESIAAKGLSILDLRSRSCVA